MTAANPIRVMVVDDSALVRGLWTRRVDAEPDMKVVASAWTGQVALDVLRRKEVDVVLLDIEMPDMDGLTALPLILEEHTKTRVIMVSTLTARGAQVTIRALSLGAADYVTKPQASGANSMEVVGDEMVGKIRALGSSLLGPALPEAGDSARSWSPASRVGPPPRAIAITSSTGGPNALSTVLGAMPKDYPLPIVIVQHMPPLFTEMLAQRLERTAGRPCSEASHGTPIEAGHTYIAPGDQHLFVEASNGRVVMRLSDHPPENFCRPSADPLFRSMAEVYGDTLLAVVLTGMGHDGLEGCRSVSARGGSVVVQDQATSVVWGMPGAVAEADLADSVLPLERIAPFLTEAARAVR